MSVDPFEVEHDVEEELAHFNGLCPVSARPSEVFFGSTRFDLSKDLLFAEELAGRARVFGHEHGRCRPCVADQSVYHFADLLPADFREADAPFDALGGKRHQALLDDIAGMLEIGRKCQDFRQTLVICVVKRVYIERSEIFLDRSVEPVDHIVHARGFRDALAIATIEGIERTAQHLLEYIDYAKRLASSAGERDAGRLARRPIEID